MINLIIPTYNNRETLPRALASIAAQTRPHKIITTIVDDASTDDISDIIENFKKLIPIQYIKLEKNLGKPGLVRQIGIDRSRCKYIMFMDSDDLLMPTAAEVLSRAMLQEDYDVLFAQFFQENSKTGVYGVHPTGHITWLHGNIYKRQFLLDNDIKFDDKFNEDGSFNLQCYWLAKKLGKLNEPTYYWMDNAASITRSNSKFMFEIGDQMIETYLNALNHIIDINPELMSSKGFIKEIAIKLALSFETIDALMGYQGNFTDSLDDKLRNFINRIKEYKIIDKKFVDLINENYNKTQVYINSYKSFTLCDFLNRYDMLPPEVKNNVCPNSN